MCNKPIGAEFDSNAPYNDQEEQSVEPETCSYCYEPTDIWHRDSENRIICPDCVQVELINNPNFKFK